MLIDELSTKKGVYALHLHLNRDAELNIGALGEVFFPAGSYIYVGSAFGPGGVRARLGRHLKGEGEIHWHIDALRRAAGVVECWYFTIDRIDQDRWNEADLSPNSYECRWSQVLAALPLVSVPVQGFGASDCRSGCASHLLVVDLSPDPCKNMHIKQTLVESLARSIHIEVADLRHFQPLSAYATTPEVKWGASYL